jgi:hypothetical protein
MEWVLGIAVVVAAAVALVLVARVRKARLQARVRLEISNEGNIESCYDLRAEDPQGVLQFRFTLNGDSLAVHGRAATSQVPVQSKASRPARSQPAAETGGVRQRAGGVIQMGGAVAGLLSMVGSLLPRSVGIPLQQKASEIRRVQAQASYAQQVPNQMAWLKSSAQRSVPGAASRPPAAVKERPAPAARGAGASGDEAPYEGAAWAQTPTVQPGETLAVELLIRSASPASNQRHPYRIISRAAGQAQADPVSEEGSAQIRGGFWARRFLPSAIILVIMIALLLLVYWLASSGALA